MYHAFEEEGKSEKKQLVSLHQQKVQAMFNRKKNILRKEYMEELEDDHPRVKTILYTPQSFNLIFADSWNVNVNKDLLYIFPVYTGNCL
jgi:hypothetical protein